MATEFVPFAVFESWCVELMYLPLNLPSLLATVNPLCVTLRLKLEMYLKTFSWKDFYLYFITDFIKHFAFGWRALNG